MDSAAFHIVEEKKIDVQAPVILFTEHYSSSSLNFVYDITGIPTNVQRLNSLLKRFNGFAAFLQAKGGGLQQMKGNTARTFMIKRGKEFYLVNAADITAFYTDSKVTFALDKTGKKFMIHQTLIELENQLSTDTFFRANRQYLINRNFINKIKQLDELKFEIIIDSGDLLHVDINQQKFAKFRTWIERSSLA